VPIKKSNTKRKKTKNINAGRETPFVKQPCACAANDELPPGLFYEDETLARGATQAPTYQDPPHRMPRKGKATGDVRDGKIAPAGIRGGRPSLPPSLTTAAMFGSAKLEVKCHGASGGTDGPFYNGNKLDHVAPIES
jgi:hypothetical protein